MATRRLYCSRCGAQSVQQVQGQRLYCFNCRSYSYLDNYQVSSYGNSSRYGAAYQPWGGSTVDQFPSPPTSHGHKRAVLCGISYKDHDQSLEGSVNDVLSMRKVLVQRFGFPESSILVLTEEGGFNYIPNKKNIRAALHWLVQGCQYGDSLVFHYSGHGSRVRDRNNDELDGYDECLLPVDYQTEGRILDDEVNATIVRPLPRGVTLHSIIDSCFCGTLLDLPNVCRLNRDGYYKWEDHQTQVYKGTSGGKAISISACDDHQSSGDSTAFTGTPTGVLTYSFIKALEQKPTSTYGHLLMTIRKIIETARTRVGLRSNDPKLSQEPILSSSQMFDIYRVSLSL